MTTEPTPSRFINSRNSWIVDPSSVLSITLPLQCQRNLRLSCNQKTENYPCNFHSPVLINKVGADGSGTLGI